MPALRAWACIIVWIPKHKHQNVYDAACWLGLVCDASTLWQAQSLGKTPSRATPSSLALSDDVSTWLAQLAGTLVHYSIIPGVHMYHDRIFYKIRSIQAIIFLFFIII